MRPALLLGLQPPPAYSLPRAYNFVSFRLPKLREISSIENNVRICCKYPTAEAFAEQTSGESVFLRDRGRERVSVGSCRIGENIFRKYKADFQRATRSRFLPFLPGRRRTLRCFQRETEELLTPGREEKKKAESLFSANAREGKSRARLFFRRDEKSRRASARAAQLPAIATFFRGNSVR